MLNKESWTKHKSIQKWKFDKYQIWPTKVSNDIAYDCMYGHANIGTTKTSHEARELCYKHAQDRK